ncbi:hypothetical protein GCM10010446_24980 [Streptomyces enissocaesilis]|uniref:Uncharacterized protein n=1 Tax=Streptomyces enissocaesilis TaxID=332589 RepID=A0ABN3X5T2_9ACTN
MRRTLQERPWISVRGIPQVCRREDLADLAAAGTPLGPEQAAVRLRAHRADRDHTARPGRNRPAPAASAGAGRHRGMGVVLRGLVR